jgi:hypothetical protein
MPAKAKPKIEMCGEKFGRWTALKVSALKPRSWLCKCKCGEERDVAISSLMSGHSLSCGCYQRELMRLRKGKKTS